MTEGRPLRLIVRFSIPMLIANALQMLYMVADSAIVGRILGINAFASVGATVTFFWFAFSMVLGIMQGFGVYFGQRFGAKDAASLKNALVTSIYLSAAISIVMGAAIFFGIGGLFRLMRTPPELIDGAILYMRVFACGMPIIFAYNLLSTALRSLGDSKTPLYVMMFCTALNIALDFALVFPFGIAGVGAATLLSYIAASAICARALWKTGVLKGCGIKPDGIAARTLLRLGLPLGFRNSVIEVGALVVQRYANEYGGDFVAGIAVAKRMYSLLMIAGGAFEAAVGTFVAQNIGAGRIDRVKKGVNDGLKLMLSSSVVISAAALLFGRFLLGLMFDGEPEQLAAVIDIGYRQLSILAFGLPLVYLLFLYRSTLQGMGKPLVPMLSGVFELIPRVLLVIFLTPVFGEWCVYISDPLGWIPATALLAAMYYRAIRKTS